MIIPNRDRYAIKRHSSGRALLTVPVLEAKNGAMPSTHYAASLEYQELIRLRIQWQRKMRTTVDECPQDVAMPVKQ
jgi:hypothetical protein